MYTCETTANTCISACICSVMLFELKQELCSSRLHKTTARSYLRPFAINTIKYVHVVTITIVSHDCIISSYNHLSRYTCHTCLIENTFHILDHKIKTGSKFYTKAVFEHCDGVRLCASAVSIQFISRIPNWNILNIKIFLWWNRFRFRFLYMRA